MDMLCQANLGGLKIVISLSSSCLRLVMCVGHQKSFSAGSVHRSDVGLNDLYKVR